LERPACNKIMNMTDLWHAVSSAADYKYKYAVSFFQQVWTV
jgi:hypothetical protein